MRADMRTYWRRPDYWRWWWQEGVSSQTKWGLAALAAIAVGILGFLSAERLTPSPESATFVTERVVTVRRTSRSTGPSLDARAAVLPSRTVTVIDPRPGEPKVVTECSYPLTAAGAADVIVTELSVFRLVDGELQLTELLAGATVDDVAEVTEAPFVVTMEESHAGR